MKRETLYRGKTLTLTKATKMKVSIKNPMAYNGRENALHSL